MGSQVAVHETKYHNVGICPLQERITSLKEGVNGTNPHREGGMFRGRSGWLCSRPNFVVQGAKNRGRCRYL